MQRCKTLFTMILALIGLLGGSLGVNEDACSSNQGVPMYSDPPFLYKSPTTGKKSVLLVAMFPIHEIGCKQILSVKNYNGLQRARAMLYALERVNEEVKSGNRNVSLDAAIYSTCSHQISSVGTAAHFLNKIPRNTIGGFVGGSYSSVSNEVSKLFQSYNISMISYASTSVDLSDKFRHPLFGRTLPSDSAQAKIVFDLALELNWTSVSILISDRSKYGASLRDAFLEARKASDKKIHICSVLEFPKIFEDKESRFVFERIVKKMLHSKVDGFIGFVTADTKQHIFDYLNDRDFNPNINIRLIGTDSWDISFKPSDKIARLLENSFVVLPESPFSALSQPLDEKIKSDFHYGKVPPLEPNGNDWMKSLYEDCYKKPCGSNVSCMESKYKSLKLDTKIDFAADAVLVYSNAFERAFEEDFTEKSFFWNHVMVNHFDDISKMNFRFEPCTGDRIVSYAIYRLDKFGEYIKVGSTENKRENQGMINDTFKPSYMRMQCRSKCDYSKGEYEDFKKVSDCCYACIKLSYRHYRESIGIQEECPVGHWPNKTDKFRSCFPMKDQGLDWLNPWIVISVVATTLGAIITTFVICFALKHSENPIFKSSSMEMAYVIWAGVVICHLNTFVLIFIPASIGSCSIQRFTMTIGYTAFLVALFLKTHKIFRIFIGQFQKSGASKLKWIAPKYQLLMAAGLTSVQIVIIGLWLSLEHPIPYSVYPGNRHVRLCLTGSASNFLAQLFNMGIAVITTSYSILSRNVPQKYNETRFINLTMYSVCIAWAIEFISKSFIAGVSAEDSHKIGVEPEKNIGISTTVTSLSATFVMIFLYVNKAYVIFKNRSQSDDVDADVRDDRTKVISLRKMEL